MKASSGPKPGVRLVRLIADQSLPDMELRPARAGISYSIRSYVETYKYDDEHAWVQLTKCVSHIRSRNDNPGLTHRLPLAILRGRGVRPPVRAELQTSFRRPTRGSHRKAA